MRKPSASASGRREGGGDTSSGRWLLTFSVALLVGLVVAATTQAAPGVIGYFELGGEFEGSLAEPSSAKVVDVDVNANGAGGADPGDIYVLGSNVRQLSAADDLLRMWGSNTVKSGPGQANEAQAVRVDATGGTFKLGFRASTTADIAATATAAQVESALNGLASIGPTGVSVTGGPGNAGGTTPYAVSFAGSSFAGADQPQLKATVGSVPLSGGGASLSAYTTNTGGSGFEICEPANGDECRDTGPGSAGAIAVNQVSGDVYITANNAIEKYSATGQLLRAWGRDVIAVGPDDSNVDEQKSVTVKATGGTFTLGYRSAFNAPVESTPPLAYDALPAAVEAAFNNLGEIGGNYSSVTVTGGPGDLTGSSPYVVTFHGLLGGDDLEDGFTTSALVSNPNGLTISSGSKSAEVKTVAEGGGEEICKAADACKEGAHHEEGEPPGPQAIRTFGSSLALVPAGAPNAGNVVAGNFQRQRVQEYTAEGAFVRSFGWAVDETEPGTGFEVCAAASGHVCKRGTEGTGLGQFGRLRSVAADSSGAIYTVETPAASPVSRVQKFTPAAGLALTPSLFGSSETQALAVNAGAGQFRLTFGIQRNGTTGTGDFTKGSPLVTNVNTTNGEFAVGQPLRNGAGTSFEYRIVAVGPGTLTLSKPVEHFVEGTLTGVPLVSNRLYRTADLPYNASAGEVKVALDSLPSVNANGGSVSVTGGPGDPTSSTPYLITFDGGPLARTDPPQIAGSDGSTPLSGGSGAGANTSSATMATRGGPDGIGDESSLIEVAVGPGDHVFVARMFPEAYTSCPDGLASPFEIGIEELDASGTVLGTSDSCNGLSGFQGSSNRHSSLTVNPSTGRPYLLNQSEPTKSALINIFGSPGPAPSLALDSVSSIGANGGTISGTVNPNGPGTSYPDTTGTPSVTRTTYRIEFKKTSESTWTKYTPDIPAGNGTSPVPFSVGVAGLAPNTEYELKTVSVKPFTGAVEETRSFKTLPGPPEIEAFSSSDVTLDSATLRALINPRGSATSYHFEYGTTPAYGRGTPETNIGEAHSVQAVQDHIEGLQDTVYHFRVVATNVSGTSTSADQTFTFHPSICPNQTVRQQTGAAYLPDCRAYELVSPEDAGGTTLYTGGPQSPYATNPPRLAFVGSLAAIPDSGRTPINTVGDLYLATRGAEGWRTRYIGPAAEEAGCVGGRPLVDGSGPPTKIQNDVMADPGLDRIINWNLGNPLECAWGAAGAIRPTDRNTAAQGSNAPYVWSAHGDFLDRWPSAVADVSGAKENFACPQDPSIHPYPVGYYGNIPVSYFCSTYVDASKDLNHFVFSTQSGLFGEGGLSAAPGSAYDNDTAHDTLRLISKLPGGGPIPQEPGAKAGPEERIQFPAVSADGSHILMGTATKPACKQGDFPFGGTLAGPLCPIVTQPTHLYMRVDGAVTYDISAGQPVHYIDSTPDVTKVYFTTKAPLNGSDTDESVDLYMWSENGGAPQLTRISAGEAGSVGNTDNCVSTWTTNCDIETYDDSSISTARGNMGGLGNWTTEEANPGEANPGYTDSAIAAQSGDIYFYSPEQLVAGKGAPGKENLYVYREGSIGHVATLEDDPYCIPGGLFGELCSDGAVGRLQVTPNGRFAAFVTTSNVTAYDSQGFAEMYRYDAEAEKVRCVSCRPDGSAPEDIVLASQGGRFITDDGRVFFDTTEPLEPSDTNRRPSGEGGFPFLGSDIYEFVDGRPQLITSGTGTGPAVLGIGSQSRPGLYGVSVDGVDVYFGTLEKLVGQDRNGQQLKFYDARTNGGFSFVPPPAPCAAADECHGPSSSPPAPLASGTGAALGVGGNAQKGKKNRRHKRKHQRQKHRKRGSHRAAQHRTGGPR